MKKNPHVGSKFDEFLEEEGIRAVVESSAIKRVLAFQVEREMKKKRLTKSRLAKMLGTSRAAVDRILNPDNMSITLHTMEKVARILGKRLEVSFY